MESIDRDYIDALVSDIENNDFELNLRELNLSVDIINRERFIEFKISVYNYSIDQTSDCASFTKNIDEHNFKKGEINKCLEYLYKLFNDDGSLRYSKITDKVYDDKDHMIFVERLETAKLLITKQKDNYSCCICKEINKVFTHCGHNLCRYCYTKMNSICCEENCSNILCPICRENIK
jgi:hypothetical protein